MLDLRLKQLADTVIEYSLNIHSGDRVLIETTKTCSDMVKYMVNKISSLGGLTFILFNETDMKRELIKNGTEESFKIMANHTKSILNEMDVYINLIDSDNCYDMSDVPDEKRMLYQKFYFQPIYFDIIVPKLRWITVDYPSISSAQQFGMSTETYENYFFDAMNTDYQRLNEYMQPLKELLDKGKHVEIISPTTHLSFDIVNQLSVICSGTVNLPDGEVFIGPDLNTAEGYVNFNVDSRYQGSNFEHIYLKFFNGEVVDFNSKTNYKKLKQILEGVEGNKKIGEFALGTNPNIKVPRSNILFDEKILGSFHIALGNAHDLSDNHNRASIHWDMVNMLTKEYGGGIILIDDELIQKNGIFIPNDLKPLNKKKLIKKEKY